MRALFQIVPVAAILVLASGAPTTATIIETDNPEACEAEADGGPFFVFNGKCYVNGEGGEVVDRSDITSFGICFGRCETDQACGAPYFDRDTGRCMHYREE
jgi:hypothetical protein